MVYFALLIKKKGSVRAETFILLFPLRISLETRMTSVRQTQVPLEEISQVMVLDVGQDHRT